MNQLTIDLSYLRPGPQARATDPASSHLAADRLERSGRGRTHREALYVAVCEHPGMTSRELAAITGLERHEAARRLPELVAAGRVVARKVPGKELTYWPKF